MASGGNTNIVIAVPLGDGEFTIEKQWWLEGPGYGGLEEKLIEEIEALDGTCAIEDLVCAVEDIITRSGMVAVVDGETKFCYSIYAFLWDDENDCFKLETKYPTGGGFADYITKGWFPT